MIMAKLLFCFMVFLLCMASPLCMSNPPLGNLCDYTNDKDSCLFLVKEISSNTTPNLRHIKLLQFLFLNSTTHIQNAIHKATRASHGITDPKNQAALIDCLKLMEMSIDRITDSIAVLDAATPSSHADAHAWLSGVLANHVMCQDGLNGPARSNINTSLNDLIKLTTNFLTMLTAVEPTKDDVISPTKGDFPLWVTSEDRKLLGTWAKDIKANVVVAQDGSGNYKTVNEAVASAPDDGTTRYVIHVKKGTYKENVEVAYSKKNVMLIGDGMNSTIITSNLSVIDGSNLTILNSATVGVDGDGFIAKDMWFQNTAGPQKNQSVALRVNSDKSLIYRCQIDSYQDTLFAQNYRQFYRDSIIAGTVDFIFGYATVVFQYCKLVARKPRPGQENIITAQGRTALNQTSGFSIQRCDIIASSDLDHVKSSIRSYLGRPWKNYSRTVVMQSNIGDHIDPAGWHVWDGDKYLDTLYYGEYDNTGAGAITTNRVKWPGYHIITSAKEAMQFTVFELIQGGEWLNSTGVPYIEGL